MTDANTLNRVIFASEAEQVMAIVGPKFDELRADYLNALAGYAATGLSDQLRANIEKMALAIKVLDTVRASVEAIVDDGKLAKAAMVGADAIERLSPEKRRFAKYFP